MRLIDADAMREEVNGFGMTVTGLRAGKGVLQNYAKHYRDSINRIIDEAPTIDAVPVVHGQWEDNGIPESVLSKCSLCGCLYGSSAFNYCPNCGAKMDMEEDDDG